MEYITTTSSGGMQPRRIWSQAHAKDGALTTWVDWESWGQCNQCQCQEGVPEKLVSVKLPDWGSVPC